jgi:hypothetical protein
MSGNQVLQEEKQQNKSNVWIKYKSNVCYCVRVRFGIDYYLILQFSKSWFFSYSSALAIFFNNYSQNRRKSEKFQINNYIHICIIIIYVIKIIIVIIAMFVETKMQEKRAWKKGKNSNKNFLFK